MTISWIRVFLGAFVAFSIFLNLSGFALFFTLLFIEDLVVECVNGIIYSLRGRK